MAFIKSIKSLFEPAKNASSGVINNIYTGVGTAFDKPIRIIILQNYTDEAVWFSFDGINDHIPLPSAGYIVLDVTGNRTNSGDGFFIAEGTRVYVKQLGIPTTGNVYVSAMYGAP